MELEGKPEITEEHVFIQDIYTSICIGNLGLASVKEIVSKADKLIKSGNVDNQEITFSGFPEFLKWECEGMILKLEVSSYYSPKHGLVSVCVEGRYYDDDDDEGGSYCHDFCFESSGDDWEELKRLIGL